MSTVLQRHIEDVYRGTKTGVLALSDPRGKLVPMTKAVLDSADDIARLVAWRNGQMRWFFTQFVATAAGTRQWLDAEVFGKPRRLFYWLEWDGHKLGQVGWKTEAASVAELDQFIRGEPGGPPDLMFLAEESLLEFLLDTCACERVIAKVLVGNLPALELHRAMAFQMTRRIPMKSVVIDGGRRLEPVSDEADMDTYAIELAIEKSDYRRAARHA
jgi:hypothetical protein